MKMIKKNWAHSHKHLYAHSTHKNGNVWMDRWLVG